MMNSKAIRRQALEAEFASLKDSYLATGKQLNYTVSEADRVKLRAQKEELEMQILRVEAELAALDAGAEEVPPDKGSLTPPLPVRTTNDSLLDIGHAKAQNASPTPLNELLPRFTQAVQEAQWDAVVSLGEDILKLDDNEAVRQQIAEGYKERGVQYHRKVWDDESALADFNRAIELAPNCATYYYWRGASLEKLGHPDQAMQDFDRAIAGLNRLIPRNPQKAEYYSLRGYSYIRKEKFDHAMADLSQAILLQQDEPYFYHGRGISYKQKGAYKEALVDLNRAISLKEDEPYFFHIRGLIYYQQGAYPSALADLNRAIFLKEDEPYFFHIRGLIHYQQGAYGYALMDQERAIELKGDAPYFYFWRGRIYKRLGQQDEAREDFRQAATLGYDEANKELKNLDRNWFFRLFG